MRVHRNCCGLDVHKHTIAACLIFESEDGSSRQQKRIFGNITQPARAGAVAGRGQGHGGGHGSDRNFRRCQGPSFAAVDLQRPGGNPGFADQEAPDR
jgi:hypothetical protein